MSAADALKKTPVGGQVQSHLQSIIASFSQHSLLRSYSTKVLSLPATDLTAAGEPEALPQDDIEEGADAQEEAVREEKEKRISVKATATRCLQVETNTCYLNAVLQAACSSRRSAVISLEPSGVHSQDGRSPAGSGQADG